MRKTENLTSPIAMQVLRFGIDHFWGFRVVEGFGPMKEDTYNDGWWLLPTYDSMQYTKACKRIEAIRKNFKIQQVIVAHEAPRLLCNPIKIGKEDNPSPVPSKLAKGLVWGLAGVLTAGIVVAAMVTLVYSLMYLLLPLTLGLMVFIMLGLGVLVDPCVIVVLEDGTRVEVMKWVE